MMTLAAIRLLLGGFLKRAGEFISANWRWLLPLVAALLLFWYVKSLQGERDDAIKSLSDYQQAAKVAADARDAQNKKIETAGKQLATDIQQGATNAIKSVYDYYGNHPRIVYRDGMRQSAASDCSGMPEAAQASGDRPSDTADNGYPTAGTSVPIQVIEPNLLPRCADTTIQALECKKYVEGLTELLNE